MGIVLNRGNPHADAWGWNAASGEDKTRGFIQGSK
jgi:hypothetical protein